MSEASDIMRRIPLGEQFFGYAYIDPRASFDLRTNRQLGEFSTCEVCLRCGNKGVSLTVQMTDIDRVSHTYQILVGLAELTRDPLLFSAKVAYVDGIWTTLSFDAAHFEEAVGFILTDLVRVVHSIMYNCIILNIAPPKSEGGKNQAWYRGFNPAEFMLIQEQSGIKIETLLDDLQMFVPHL